jgi:hypothetical protein
MISMAFLMCISRILERKHFLKNITA